MAKKLTTAERLTNLEKNMYSVEQLINACNNAIIALAYSIKLKGDELDELTAEGYKEFVENSVHPMMKRVTSIVDEIVKEAREAIENMKEEEK